MLGVFANEAPRYFAAGANVLPIVPGTKRPCVPWREWQARRQTDVEAELLLRAYPQADLAIILGKGSGGLVDIETDGATGEEALRALRLPVPSTAVFTSRRGAHRPFRSGRRVPTRKGLRPQLDVLATGSYIIVPTSAGREWICGGIGDVAPLPQEWEEFLLAGGGPSGQRTLREIEQTGVQRGKRNNTLTSLVGRWLSQRLPEEAIRTKARAWAQQCVPPLPVAEVEKIVRSILQTRQRARSPEREAWLLAVRLGLDHSAMRVLLGLVVLKEELGVPGPTVTAPHRLLADYSGVAKNTVGPALRRLLDTGLIKTSKGRDPRGRQVTIMHLRAPLAVDGR